MLSYWEQNSFLHYDHVIIGSGIVGLSTALELREHFPSDRIIILERGLLPTGASTRNAGFACTGSPSELLDDLLHVSEEEVVSLFLLRKKGLERLRNRFKNDALIGYRTNGSHELISAAEQDVPERLAYLNGLLYPIAGHDTFHIRNERIDTFGFSKAYVQTLLESTCEGELHTGKLLRALCDLAIENRIEIKTGAEVVRFEEEESCVTTFVKDPIRKEFLPLQSRTLCLCTNAFTRQLLPDADVTPGRGQVLITEPIEGLKFKGVFHFDRGYYYFREVDDRVLFGGGRNLDFEGETTTELEINTRIQQDLEEKLRTIILPTTPFKVAQRWSGIMAFGPTKRPVVTAFSKRLFGGFRMGGMGVALGSETAHELALLVAEYQG